MRQQRGSRQSGASWPTVIVLILLGVASTAAVAVLVSWRPAPESLSAAQLEPGTIVVTRQGYDDSRDVELAVTQGASAQLLATTSGIVTSSTCRPGAIVTSGAPVGTIGQRRVLPLATTTPAYREITVGTSGSDVTSLRAELVRLGVIPRNSRVTDPADERLVSAARRLAGLPPPSSSAGLTLPLGSFAWTPAIRTAIATCAVPVGASVSAGEPLLSLSPPVTALTLVGVPPKAAPGPRELILDSVTVPLTRGRVTSEKDLAMLVSTPAWAGYEQSAGKVPLQGQWRLKTPLQVASLPAASLRTPGAGGGRDDAACVSSNGRAMPVTIIASSLGRTLVTFAGAWPATVDATPAEALSCG